MSLVTGIARIGEAAAVAEAPLFNGTPLILGTLALNVFATGSAIYFSSPPVSPTVSPRPSVVGSGCPRPSTTLSSVGRVHRFAWSVGSGWGGGSSFEAHWRDLQKW
jgi:hypothetical protein